MRLPWSQPTIELNKEESAALLFHYHKNGIPASQTGAKRLERKLCDFVGEETKDVYVSPCAGVRHDGEIEGEGNLRSRLRDLRRENECTGGDQVIVNAVRLVEEQI